MTKFMTGLAIGAALLASLPASAAQSICTITDTSGNRLVYGFTDVAGAPGMTSQNLFVKNGHVLSRPYHREIWLFRGNDTGGLVWISTETPEWSIRAVVTLDGVAALLWKRGEIKGAGSCTLIAETY